MAAGGTALEDELWIWRGLRFRVPSDWEMLQFSRNPDEGRCAFADRYMFRLELNWRKVDGPPDFRRMLDDYQAKLKDDEDISGVGRKQAEGWPGVEARIRGRQTTRFGRYLTTPSCLVELVFLWPDAEDGSLTRRVLGSFEAEAPRTDGRQRWRAFGMDMLASGGLPLAECKTAPGLAELCFGDEDSHVRERFARRGMVKEWLAGTVDEWVRHHGPKRNVLERPVRQEHGHRVVELHGDERAPWLRGYFGRRRHEDVAGWICPEDGRLYSVRLERRGSADAFALDPPAARLGCCAERGVVT